MGSDTIILNFLKKLDSTDCSMWVLERSGEMMIRFKVT